MHPHVHQHVAGLLRHPLPRRVRGHPGQEHAAGRELDHEEHPQPLQEHGLHRQEIAGQEAVSLRGEEPPPAGSRPAWRRVHPRAFEEFAQTVLAPIRYPSWRASPWTRRQPQPGFSFARRSTSRRSSAATGGRPRHRRVVQRRRTRPRCQPNKVSAARTAHAADPGTTSDPVPAKIARSAQTAAAERPHAATPPPDVATPGARRSSTPSPGRATRASAGLERTRDTPTATPCCR